jgi:hypothetical protein
MSGEDGETRLVKKPEKSHQGIITRKLGHRIQVREYQLMKMPNTIKTKKYPLDLILIRTILVEEQEWKPVCSGFKKKWKVRRSRQNYTTKKILSYEDY